ncbi:MAG: ADP-ribosylglycohydrolase family protein [Bacteroidales bacterium]
MKTLQFISALLITIAILAVSCKETGSNSSLNSNGIDYKKEITIGKEELKDKIKGGWAGQVIGCTYGGPTEFRYCGTMIQDYTPIIWDSTRMKWYYENEPGLYDDVYMDLTFVEVFEKEGLDAPALSHAKAFANAGYMLWHANQAARYNILNGIEPPASGHWENNPHSEDIDFEIEADFAGLMSPAMPNTSSEICDKVGHIMNYGDGWYGGVYVAAMYSLAFVSNDIEFIVKEALKTIPEETEYYKCIKSVIDNYYKYPDDWKKNWFEVQKDWSSDIGCPDGVFHPFNIDAKINSAYIVIGLLYGKGDYGKTLEISARCGQDSDCNPANAGGILGALLGYNKIPDYWKQGIKKVEDMDFKYTSISLNDVYEMGYNQALKNLENHGGKVSDSGISMLAQEPKPVKLEKGFVDHFPKEIIQIENAKNSLNRNNPEYNFTFRGNGFVVRGNSQTSIKTPLVNLLEVYIDGQLVETAKLPTDFTTRRYEICWKYNLKPEEHQVKLVLKNARNESSVQLYQVLVYDQKKADQI